MNLIESTIHLLDLDFAIARSTFAPACGAVDAVDLLPPFTPQVVGVLPAQRFTERSRLLRTDLALSEEEDSVEEDALRPCPFCGGEARVEWLGCLASIVCFSADCVAKTRYSAFLDIAKAAWNRRVADAQIAALEARLAATEANLSKLRATFDERHENAMRRYFETADTPATQTLKAQLGERMANWREALDLLDAAVGE